ncbi:unnamed protein product [Moneuplotes crassus]|uniref:Uncharacterized protein n=1 Tax=Euplotes crassus TaxID=5936 RepID=A0AAD1UD63_EUPCR|nr:unnamed protein product [Moneuplotes crassus]
MLLPSPESKTSFLSYKSSIRTNYRTRINEETKKAMLKGRLLYEQKKEEGMRRKEQQRDYFNELIRASNSNDKSIHKVKFEDDYRDISIPSDSQSKFINLKNGKISANSFFGIKAPKRKCCLLNTRKGHRNMNNSMRIRTGVEYIEKKCKNLVYSPRISDSLLLSNSKLKQVIEHQRNKSEKFEKVYRVVLENRQRGQSEMVKTRRMNRSIANGMRRRRIRTRKAKKRELGNVISQNPTEFLDQPAHNNQDQKQSINKDIVEDYSSEEEHKAINSGHFMNNSGNEGWGIQTDNFFKKDEQGENDYEPISPLIGSVVNLNTQKNHFKELGGESEVIIDSPASKKSVNDAPFFSDAINSPVNFFGDYQIPLHEVKIREKRLRLLKTAKACISKRRSQKSKIREKRRQRAADKAIRHHRVKTEFIQNSPVSSDSNKYPVAQPKDSGSDSSSV